MEAAKAEEEGTKNVEIVEEPKVSQTLSDEIDVGVSEAVKIAEQDRKDRVAEEIGDKKVETDLPPDKDPTGDEDDKGKAPADEDSEVDGAEDDGGKVPAEDAVTDALLERAVKAGFSLGEARKFPSATMLEGVCDRLEVKASTDDGGEGGKKDEIEEVDLFEGLPDLDPEIYDEKIVAVFNGLKDVVRKQYSVIQGMETGKASTWFESQVSALGKPFEKALAVGSGKLAELKEQFDVLVAGYKASGKEDVDLKSVFDTAVTIALGDVKKEIADAAAEKVLGKRGKQHISRPSGKTSKPTTDAFEDVAKEIDAKFSDKN